MALGGWGLFGTLFAVSDTLDTKKKAQQNQLEAQKRIAQRQQEFTELKSLQNKNYLAESDKNELIFSSSYIEVKQSSLNEYQINWNCNIPYNSIANEFEICRNYENKPPQIISTIPFIKGNTTYSFIDELLESETGVHSYSVYLKGIYDGTLIKSRISCSASIQTSIPKLKKITLNAETRNNNVVKLFWNYQADVSSYKVFRSEQETNNFILINLLAGNSKRYTDHNVVAGKTYTYYVQATALHNNSVVDERCSNKQCITVQAQEELPSKKQTNSNKPTKQKTIDFDHMEGHDFESFCANILKENGFKKVSVTKGSGDQGIDILATKDGIKYGIQCKCYSSEVGNKAVQEAFSGKSFYNTHIAVVLTNNLFTSAAKELAEKNGVILWDRKHLLKMIEQASKNKNSLNE